MAAASGAATKLQRGLGFAAEDKAGRARQRRLSHQASTGPRLRCRGWGELDARGPADEASTEPRLRSRGQLVRTAGARAASTEPRPRCRGSGFSRARYARASSRFNGASASQPRTGRQARLKRCRCAQLQRSLGFAAEDSCASRRRGSLIGALQRGLGFAAEDRSRRAMRARLRHGPAAIRLQRGLGFVAEDRAAAVTCGADSPMSFNGASASQPRTGPPSASRFANVSASRRQVRCFNGASASQPRRVRRSRDSSPVIRRVRFNGASASQPRTASAHDRRRTPSFTRGFNGASASQPRIEDRYGSMASVAGQRFNGASASQPRTAPGAGNQQTFTRTCFNGASASQPRTVMWSGDMRSRPRCRSSTGPRLRSRGCKTVAGRFARDRLLQRSLGFAAEDVGAAARGCRRAGPGASTGPRLRCRGSP